MSDDDLRQHESGQLDAEDRQRIRRDFGRNDTIWSKFGGEEGELIRLTAKVFGPAASIIATIRTHWRYIMIAGAVVTLLNTPRIAEAVMDTLPVLPALEVLGVER